MFGRPVGREPIIKAMRRNIERTGATFTKGDAGVVDSTLERALAVAAE